ncbi:MAG: endonuclease III domain-containing protein [Desulfotalea sp.]
MKNLFQEAFERLEQSYGEQGSWWLAENPFEIIVGAILAQNTSWQNVEKVLFNLKQNELLVFDKLKLLSIEELAQLIRSSGFHNVKAKRLRSLLTMISDLYDGDIQALLEDDMYKARENLLQVKGVGLESADAILLYAADRPLFVIDSYTHRVFSRHGMVDEETDYQEMQDAFMANLSEDVRLYKGFHGLIVEVAKEFCKKKRARCASCPLNGLNEKCFEDFGVD